MLTIIVNCFYDDNVRKMNEIERNFLENAKNDFINVRKRECDRYRTILQTFIANILFRSLYIYLYNSTFILRVMFLKKYFITSKYVKLRNT